MIINVILIITYSIFISGGGLVASNKNLPNAPQAIIIEVSI